MKTVNKTTSKSKTDSKLFTKSGTFLKVYQVTVDQKSDKGFVFALKSKSDDGTFSTDEQLVNRTFIPTTSCDDSASPEGLSSESQTHWMEIVCIYLLVQLKVYSFHCVCDFVLFISLFT